METENLRRASSRTEKDRKKEEGKAEAKEEELDEKEKEEKEEEMMICGGAGALGKFFRSARTFKVQ